MIEMVEREEGFSLNQASSLLGLDQHRMAYIIQNMESRGYQFTRSSAGTIEIHEQDLMMILCFT
ncbi:hypothetical protein [Paenibacillus cremeus]|uniref:Uncharacterized protein n=1 Tax=Paenibacillus cremeus TaxID=2163881 RepID=A0A559K9H8_9BACL|nr:hypothetical protein [Paenibacillus cremeus]TVY08769.1 hypothetical protein FPZ49_17105 [Paenibacillus cremeus]